MENIERLLSEFRPSLDRYLQIRKEKAKRGEYFNIFEVLGISRKETITHSPFIAELLNPQGCHGCESALLGAFLEIVLQKHFTLEELEKAEVKTEKFIGYKNDDATEGGRLDILITIGTNLIIIENKIDAKDEENQLLRYFNHAESLVREKKFTSYQLLYLTLLGNEASDYSTGRKLKVGKDYETISYSHDILSWLEQCKILSIDIPLVRETLTQYITIIKKITNQDMEEKEKEQMFAVMEKYSEEAARISHIFKEFRNYVFKKYCVPEFEEEASKRNLRYCYCEAENGFYFQKQESTYYGIYIWTDKVDVYHYYISISFPDETTPKDFRKVKREQLLGEETKECYPKGYKYLSESLDWSNPSIIKAFKDGTYVKVIMKEVDEVLKIIEDKHIKLP